MRKRTRLGLFAGLAALTTALATGCQSDNQNDVSYSAIRGDLTPALQTSIERPIDVDRTLAVTDDTNLRFLMDDLGSMFYTDRPSRLTAYPVIKSSGQP